MTHRRKIFRMTLAGAAVAAALPMANIASAQDLQSASCNRLLVLVDEAGDDNLAPDFIDARTIAVADDPNDCSLYVARVAQAGSISADGSQAEAQSAADSDSDSDTETETTSETVQVEQEATIQGEVQVRLPDPQVDIEQSPAEIQVRDANPAVTVDQGQPTIVVRQAPPSIKVEMAQPTITVDQPAPEIIITMPEPGVNVASAQPQVEVNIPEPQVTVTQGEPQLDVDLETEVGDAAADADPDLQRSDEDGSMVVTKSGQSSSDLAPRIEYVQSTDEPDVTINSAEPDVQYEAAEPQIDFTQTGEPEINVTSSGEPKITFNQADDDSAQAPADDGASTQQAMAPADAEEADVEVVSTEVAGADEMDTEAVAVVQRDPSEAFAADPSDAADDGSPMQAVAVNQLDGLDVVNGRGEELGEVENIVKSGEDTYVIVKHGGWFLGLNEKEVAFPIGNVMVRDNQVVLRGLTEDQIKQMPDYDYDSDVELSDSEEVDVMVGS